MAEKRKPREDKFTWQEGQVVWDKPIKKPAPKKNGTNTGKKKK